MIEKHIDPIPENFRSLEEAGEFWDTHDTMDYPDAFQTVEVNAELRNRYYEVEIDMNVAQALRDKARQQGVTTSSLATEMIRRQLSAA
ncbi:MAG: BrnA antitoxin family protein [Armatimonadetes bacterium]|nr:BrnA antitoxin family protein [Armatimonadota bacterium]